MHRVLCSELGRGRDVRPRADSAAWDNTAQRTHTLGCARGTGMTGTLLCGTSTRSTSASPSPTLRRASGTRCHSLCRSPCRRFPSFAAAIDLMPPWDRAAVATMLLAVSPHGDECGPSAGAGAVNTREHDGRAACEWEDPLVELQGP
jgi:hypothetical protein